MAYMNASGAIGLKDAGYDYTSDWEALSTTITSGSRSIEMNVAVYYSCIPQSSGYTAIHRGAAGAMYGYALSLDTSHADIQLGYSVHRGAVAAGSGTFYSSDLGTNIYGSDYRSSAGYTTSNWTHRSWPESTNANEAICPANISCFSSISGLYSSSGSAIGSLGSGWNGTYTSENGTGWKVTQILWHQDTVTSAGTNKTWENISGGTLYGGTHNTSTDAGNFFTISMKRTDGGTITSSDIAAEDTFKKILMGNQYFYHYNCDSIIYSGSYINFRWKITDAVRASIGSTGSKTFKIYGNTQTPKNGIAELHGGNDTTNIALSEYYSGGAYTHSSNTSVPTSGAISMGDFYDTIHGDPTYMNTSNINITAGFNEIHGGGSTTQRAGTRADVTFKPTGIDINFRDYDTTSSYLDYTANILFSGGRDSMPGTITPEDGTYITSIRMRWRLHNYGVDHTGTSGGGTRTTYMYGHDSGTGYTWIDSDWSESLSAHTPNNTSVYSSWRTYSFPNGITSNQNRTIGLECRANAGGPNGVNVAVSQLYANSGGYFRLEIEVFSEGTSDTITYTRNYVDSNTPKLSAQSTDSNFSCILPDTIVEECTKGFIPASEVEQGDKIKAKGDLNDPTVEDQYVRVLGIEEHPRSGYYDLMGVGITGDHPIRLLNANEWIKVEDLNDDVDCEYVEESCTPLYIRTAPGWFYVYHPGDDYMKTTVSGDYAQGSD